MRKGITTMFDSPDKELPLISPSMALPVMSREKFAELVGLPVGVIIGFCNRGYLPCMSIGRYSLINVALLQNRCLAKEFEK